MIRFLFLFLVILCLAPSAMAQEKSSDEIKRIVATLLKDPDSARYSGVKHAAGEGTVLGYYCGTVNARNSFGGYTGPIPFLVQDDLVAVLLEGEEVGKHPNLSLVFELCEQVGVEIQ